MRAPQQPGGPIPQRFGAPASGVTCASLGNDRSLPVGAALPHANGRRVRDVNALSYETVPLGWVYRDDRGALWFGPYPDVVWELRTAAGPTFGDVVARSLGIWPPRVSAVRIETRGVRLDPHLAVAPCFSAGATLLR